MKKLVLLASVALALMVYQPTKAQVSFNLSIGSGPYYEPAYYVPARTVVYAQPVVYREPVVYHHRPVVYQKRYVNYRSYAPVRTYRSSYSRPSYRSYEVKHVKFHGYKNHGKGHGRGRH